MLDRKTFMGSSDIAAAMGMSRWKTPLQLWAEKRGEVDPEDISDKEHVQLGIELEDFVARKFSRETGLSVRRSPKIYESSAHPYMKAQVDRLITGTDDLLECKTCSAWKEKEWEGEEIPIEYILQVSWQLMITGRKTGYIAVLIGGQKFRWKKIEADAELFVKMKNAAITFWDMVQNNIPPVAESDDNSFMAELFPTANDVIKEATQDIVDAVAMLQQTKAQIIDLKKTKDEIEARVKASIEGFAGVFTPEYTIKWTPIITRRVDAEKMKNEGIYDNYVYITKSRKLTIKKNKGV